MKRKRLRNLEDREEHLESTLLKGNQTTTTRFKVTLDTVQQSNNLTETRKLSLKEGP